MILTLVDSQRRLENERVVRRNEALAAVGQATTQLAHEIKILWAASDWEFRCCATTSVTIRKHSGLSIWLSEACAPEQAGIDVTQFSRRKPLERATVDLNDALSRSLDLVADKIHERIATPGKRFADRP